MDIINYPKPHDTNENIYMDKKINQYDYQLYLDCVIKYIEQLICHPKPIDQIISSEFSLVDKKCLIENVICCLNTTNSQSTGGISPTTISILLPNKQHDPVFLDPIFLDLLQMIIQFSYDNEISILPIDQIILSKLSLDEKKYLIENIINYSKTMFHHPTTISILGISPTTISFLLEDKQNNVKFFDIFSIIINFSHDAGILIFTYDHLYHLVTQQWIDLPIVFSTNFRKKFILVGLNGHIPMSIIEQIQQKVDKFFPNFNKNQNVTEMINWLCDLDETGILNNTKNKYMEKMETSIDNTKAFIKKYCMTENDYKIKQEKAKKNGVCDSFRKGLECSNGVNCKFYHGKLPETFAIQKCKDGINCTRLANGKCTFVHEPTTEQLTMTQKFYYSLKKDTNGFSISPSQTKFVDANRKSNPFIILQKDGIIDNKVHYSIPVCSYIETNDFGCSRYCNKPVKFMTMTKKANDKSNFYCSYEHMTKSETPTYFLVKQNILDKIFDAHK
jgi:hypothetical protein